jgi:hypothetical protein
MPNKLTFAAPIAGASLSSARIVDAGRVSMGAKTITVGVELLTAGGVASPAVFQLEVTDSVSDVLVADAASPAGLVQARAAIPSAFSQVMGAFVAAAASGQSAESAMLGALQSLGILPAGAVS